MYILLLAVNVVVVIVVVVIVGAASVVKLPVLGVVTPILILLIVPNTVGDNTIDPVVLIVIVAVLLTVSPVNVPTRVKLLLTTEEPKDVRVNIGNPLNVSPLVVLMPLAINAPVELTLNPGLLNPACDSNGL